MHKLKALGAWIWSIWTRPTPQAQMLDLMKEVVKLQQSQSLANQAQSQVFTTLLQAWTAPVPTTQSYISPEDRDILAHLEDAAQQGDADAQTILGDPKLRHDYFETFR